MDKLFLNTLRSVKRTFGRFLAILAIIAISSAFYAGVKDCAPRLKDTAWRYYNNTALADVKLISTLGFDTQSLEYLYSFDNVSAAYAGYSYCAAESCATAKGCRKHSQTTACNGICFC